MKDDIQKVPKNALTGGNANLNYKTKISDPTASATGTYTSLFAAVLGSSDSGGIIGGFYSNFANVTSTLDTIKNGSQSFASGASGFTSNINSMTSDLNQVQNQMTDLDNSLKTTLDLL